MEMRVLNKSICLKSMESTLLYQIALTMAKGVGIHTIKNLLSAWGEEANVFNRTLQELQSIPNIGETTAQNLLDPLLLEKAKKELNFVARIGGRAIPYTSEDYPTRLRECNDAPFILYTKGNINFNTQHAIGIVGTRKMTNYGKEICEEIISDLADKYPDLLVISGLAHGVDGCAHKKALDLGLSTIGVVGHGLDLMYPAQHRALAEKMMEKGGMVTEYRAGCFVDKKNFVSRNRIIAGLSDVILVVESGEKGGALFTAEFANSYNRDVCAIPGRIGDSYSAGCNQLIKSHQAVMVESAEEIEKLMNWDVSKATHPTINISKFMALSGEQKIIVEALQLSERMEINELVKKTQIPYGKLSSLLFEMEMDDLVRTAPGNVYYLPIGR